MCGPERTAAWSLFVLAAPLSVPRWQIPTPLGSPSSLTGYVAAARATGADETAVLAAVRAALD
ncbi:hypothetical protein [Streptomyces sp. NPDC050164]|uniref:hypothetical protein n=1 Tax=Streptomyces sp. NPDC050164 TaxID=3365605 RepID=UPI0037941195